MAYSLAWNTQNINFKIRTSNCDKKHARIYEETAENAALFTSQKCTECNSSSSNSSSSSGIM